MVWAKSLQRMGAARITRRRYLKASAAAAGGALLLACGGGNGSGLKLDDSASSRTPGTVWFAKNDWNTLYKPGAFAAENGGWPLLALIHCIQERRTRLCT